jgi:hypothetical protein
MAPLPAKVKRDEGGKIVTESMQNADEQICQISGYESASVNILSSSKDYY